MVKQEREFVSALQSATTWVSDGKLLDRHRADGEHTLKVAGN